MRGEHGQSGGPRRGLLAWGAISSVLVLVLGAAACGSGDDDARLVVLRTDPMAEVELTGATDVRVTEAGGSTGAKPVPARIRHTFTIEDDDIGPAIDELAAAAEDAGWVLTPRVTVGFDGTKTIDDLDAQLLIAGIEAERRVWVEVSTRDT